MKNQLLMLVAGVMCFSCYCFSSDKAEKIYVPDELKPWQKWVLYNHKTIDCPEIYGAANYRQCVWPSQLSIDLKEKEAEFEFKVQLFADDYVVIPGDSVFWPCEVTVNGKRSAVIRRNNAPTIDLSAGTYKINGVFKWDIRPNALKIPEGTALVSLQIGNRKIPRISIDKNSMLWLKEENESTVSDSLVADNVEVRIYRKIVDAIPLYIITMVKLIVSGHDRELVLGRFLPDGAVPVYLHSELPARIDTDGNVKVQVKNGTWIIEMKSRLLNNKGVLKVEQKTRDWPSQEIWALQADPRLRSISIKGAQAIDPGQTGIPEEWKQLPVFLVTKDNSFGIFEEQRGDYSPDPDNLTIERTLWLDFNGSGFTVKDKINGTVSRPGRLAMDQGFTLGSVVLNGIPQMVTTVGENIPGVEYSQGELQLECVSRSKGTEMSAGGWNQAFANVRSTLHIPPGWSVFYINGTDYVYNTWISRWTVWDIFLLLLLVVSIYRIFNLKWSLIAAGAFLLTFHEKGAPLFLWLNLIAGVALVNAIPKVKVKKVVAVYTIISFLAVTGICLGFALTQVRQALYPQLEMKNSAVDREVSELKYNADARSSSVRKYVTNQAISQNLVEYDPNAVIQTGPGEPLWKWNQVTFGWSGPVERDQRIKLLFISPIVNRVINVIRVCMIFLLLFGLGRVILKFDVIRLSNGRLLKKSGITGIFIIWGILCPLPANAEIPSQSILNELEKRLTEKTGTCGIECISVQQGSIGIKDEKVMIKLLIDASETSSILLPGNRASWYAEKVSVNDIEAPALRGTYEGGLLIVVPVGHNKVELTGRLSDNRTEIHFPFPVNNMTVDADKWIVSGIANGKIPGGVIRLDKKETTASAERSKQSKNLNSDQALPFVEVTRNINLDKEWGVSTSVRRISPESEPLCVSIPLLQTESIISSVISDPVGFITVYLKRDQQEFSWQSTLKITPEINLEVPSQDKYVEVWNLNHSPRWHVETSGLSQIKKDAGAVQSSQVWCPLPGEKVMIKIQKPQVVEGSTMTLKEVNLNYNPGIKTSENRLKVSVLSSQADRIQFTLPKNSILDGVNIDGTSQIVTYNNSSLSVPIHPGTQTVNINWKTKDTLKLLTKTPLVDCGMSSSNTTIECVVPKDRWVLFAGGPMMGPALLFWAMLIVLLSVAIFLGKMKSLPLKWYHWFLLSAGMSTVDNIGGILVVLWFFALSIRSKTTIENKYFNFAQIGCILLTIAAMGSLIATIPLGLLSTPDMQISGNGSSSHFLRWFQDLSSQTLPQGWFISLPIWVYRLLMLLWSLWLALCLTKWVKWGWNSFSSGGVWKTKAKKIVNTSGT